MNIDRSINMRTIGSALRFFVLLVMVFLALGAELQAARPLLHPLFCDHMVLQRDTRVPVWGWAEPGTKVTVVFAGQQRSAVADSDGRWMARLRRMRASAEPRTLQVASSQGGSEVTVQDVLVGDVWLCSGQSNMEMGVEQCDVPDEIATANFPQLRLLAVPKRIATEPETTLECHWVPCSPQSLVEEGFWGGFTAAGFFFGRELHQALDVPIGLIQSAWGGTVAEAWTSEEGLEPLGDFANALAQLDNLRNRSGQDDYPEVYEAWCQDHDPGSKQGWNTASTRDAGWRPVQMPQPIETAGLPGFDGMVWFQHEFEMPHGWEGKELQLQLGPIDDIDTTWIDGVRIGQMNQYDAVRTYTVPAGGVNVGPNRITVRVLDTGGGGGFFGSPEQMTLSIVDDESTPPLSLAGSWWMRESAPISALPTPPVRLNQGNPNVTTVLYNGMIAPLLPFAIKGAIWYQGESNADRAQQYQRLLPAMITDWRSRFGVGDFPFYIVQLAAWQATHPEPRDNNWAELREAQAQTAKHLRNCGLALALDVGDADDIHPKDKRTVGQRLAVCALAEDYGKKIEYSGPWYRSMKVTDSGILLKFDHVGGGLVSRGGKLSGFAIAGEDHKFVWADALIVDDRIMVSSPNVPKPVAVRYAWDINPVCNLYNKAGLPAVPFRTDDWPMITAGRK